VYQDLVSSDHRSCCFRKRGTEGESPSYR